MALLDRWFVRLASDVVCPERCAACDAVVDARALFCRDCLASTRCLCPPECPGCGAPQPASRPCAACRLGSGSIRTARAWAAYQDAAAAASPVAHAIARFKYHGARRLGRRLATAIHGRIPDPTVGVVIPVPLHVRRLRARGFNQSAVLARHLARRLGCPVALGAVVRTRDTPTQVGTGAAERAANVANAFIVSNPTRVHGRSVLVVDDVWTSGATARAVAHALRQAGAVAVDVLTIARVI